MKVRLLFLLLLTLSSPALAQTPSIEYTLTIKNPVSHLYDVRMDISGTRTTSVDVAMPAWSPGIYAIRDFARNVQEFEVTTRQNRPLSWEQHDIPCKGSADAWRRHYRVPEFNPHRHRRK